LQFETHQYYNCEIEVSGGRKYRVEANWIHNNNLDNWHGWECDIGVTRLYINSDNEVYGGQCLVSHLGNLNTDWTLNQTPVTCTRQRCTGCTDDLMISKRKV
jgi:hypothetical protein